MLERILRERYSPRRLLREFRKRAPELMTRAPEMPRLLHAWLEQQVEGRHEMGIRSQELAEVARTLQTMQRRSVAAILGSGLLVVAAVVAVEVRVAAALVVVAAAASVAAAVGLRVVVVASVADASAFLLFSTTS